MPTAEALGRLAFERDLLQYETDNEIKVWTGLIALFTGVAAVVARVIAWRNLRETQKKLEVDREAQITNRFTQAVGQFGAELKDGKPNLEVRLGAIYALERIAQDSPHDVVSIQGSTSPRCDHRWPQPYKARVVVQRQKPVELLLAEDIRGNDPLAQACPGEAPDP